VAAAIPLDEPLRERVRETFARATGRRIVLHERVDPALKGGMVVQLGDTRIDGSVRARLEDLRARMLEAARAMPAQAPGA
jgi:F-type H+-transporting ATPase subunit delta